MSAIRKFLLQRASDLEKIKEVKRRHPEDSLISIRFSDDHVHHLLPADDNINFFVDDLISTEGLTLPAVEKETLEVGMDKILSPIIFKNRQAIGDILMMSCSIRDFKRAFPDSKINVSTTASHIWDYNPYIDRTLTPENAEVIEIGPSYLTNASNRDDRHFANAFRVSMEEKLLTQIPQGPIKPDIWMTEEEVNSPPLIEPPYWIITAGEKGDWTSKTYPFHRWQQITKAFRGIKFVQIGAKEHKHPKLEGNNVINWIGETQGREDGIRRIFKLFYHAEGSIGLVSFQMHLAAAFNMPCVTIAGAREPARFTRYPNQQYLCTDGCLPCASQNSCWSCKMEKSCKMIDEEDGIKFPRCMGLIQVADVIRSVEQYYDGERLSFDHPRKPTLPNPIVKGTKSLPAIKKALPERQSMVEDSILEKWGYSWGGSNITELDWAFIKKIIEDNDIRKVLEFGSGLSTLLFNNLGLSVLSYETDVEFIKKVQEVDSKCNIEQWNGSVEHENIKKLIGWRKLDLVFVDGPQGGENREGSIQASSVVSDLVIIHDAGRPAEKKWQDKYLKGKFDLVSKGGHRCNFWKRKPLLPEVKEKDFPLVPNKFKPPQKLFRMVFNGRGEGGAERSTTLIMKKFIELGWNIEYVCPQGISGTFRKSGLSCFPTRSLDLISEPCDILMLYTNDWVWEFPKSEISNKFENLKTKRKVMCVNYRLGKIGEIPWTQNWDEYIFLNSSLEFNFLSKYAKAIPLDSPFPMKTKVLPPCTDLSPFLDRSPNFAENLKLIRHSSQGDAKYPKDFNEKIERILDVVPGIEIYLMPAPSFLNDFGNRVRVFKRNQPSVEEFLSKGNCFWYHLPDGYEDQGPKVIMEAQSVGLPVIADNHSGPKDRVVENTGMLCNTFEDHLKAIESFTNQEYRESCGKKAKKHAEESYNPDRWISEIIGQQK